MRVSDLILRSTAKRCVSKDDATELESALVDDLVGGDDQRLRYGEAKRLGGLEIDNQFVAGRCLYRKLGRLFASQNAIDVGRRTLEQTGQVRTIRYQAVIEAMR